MAAYYGLALLTAEGSSSGASSPSLPSSRAWFALALSLAGAALLALPGARYRIDALGDYCDRWPPLATNLEFGAFYLLAVALMTIGWRWMARAEWSARRILITGSLIHLIALLAPPFLSLDPLYYVAIGRSLAHGANAYAPLSASLPPDDAALSLLPVAWKLGTSPYWPGFNQLAKSIALLFNGSLVAQLRAWQFIGAASMIGTAALAARSVEPAARARAAALVIFCPLAIIEGTANAHNDNLVALAAAAFAVAVSRRREGLGFGALLTGLLVKASSLIPIAIDGTRLVFARLGRRLTPARVALGGAFAFSIVIVSLLFLRGRYPVLNSFSALLGWPTDEHAHCTRSVECLPRAFLHEILHLKTAAWIIGLVFRVLGGAWLLYAGARGARESRPLAWMAAGLFFYYWLFHGFMESWYLLPLVALLPHASPRLFPAMRLLLTTSVLYYVVRLPLNCNPAPLATGLKEFSEAAIVILPVAFLLLRRREAA